jgi:hypothetical protein
MAASFISTIVMGLYFALLFFAILPGNILTLPNNDKGSDDMMVRLTHAAVFALVLVFSYTPVANFIHKSL